MTVINMIPTRHYRQIATGDRVYGGGQCVGIRAASHAREMITFHPTLKWYHAWPKDQANRLHGFYESESCAE